MGVYMLKKLSLSFFAAVVAVFSIITISSASYASHFRWTQMGTQTGGYYGLYMRHCGNDAVGPGECSWRDYRRGETCFMYWGSYDLGHGQKVYPIFQCQRGW